MRGNKVEDQASWLGLGWTISGGGSITRTVTGPPDDLQNANQVGFNYMGQKISDHLNHVYNDAEDRAYSVSVCLSILLPEKNCDGI